MSNQECLDIFERYLRDEKNASSNTLSSYMRDLRQLSEYLELHTKADLVSAKEEELQAYIQYLRDNGKSVATVSQREIGCDSVAFDSLH